MTVDLDAIKRRLAAATPGPWRYLGNRGTVTLHGFPAGPEIETPGGTHYGWAAADAEFIAHARADIADLVAEVERASGQAQQARAHLFEALGWVDSGSDCAAFIEAAISALEGLPSSDPDVQQ